MKKYWIDYSASICIEAENEEDARGRFWNGAYDTAKKVCVDLDVIEEVSENVD